MDGNFRFYMMNSRLNKDHPNISNVAEYLDFLLKRLDYYK
jgi:hypothetical protein